MMTIKQKCAKAHQVGRVAGFLHGVLFTLPLLLIYIAYAFRLAHGWHDEVLLGITLIWGVAAINKRLTVKLAHCCNNFGRRLYSKLDSTAFEED